MIGITFHEFSHAWAANALGDRTAKNLGRMTLNPIAHLDPVGTVLIFVAGFGWGKPVPFNPIFLRIGRRSGAAVVSIAGPIANVIAATIFAFPIRAGLVESNALDFSVFGRPGSGVLQYFLISAVFWNLILAVFNLLPIAPLDGFKVAVGVLPRNAAAAFARLEPYGPVILLLIIGLGFFSPDLRILSGILGPVVNLLSGALLGADLL